METERVRVRVRARVRGRSAAAVAAAALLALLTGCGGDGGAGNGGGGSGARPAPSAAEPSPPRPSPRAPEGIPGVGERLRERIPGDSRQVLAVYGEGAGSARSTAVLFTRADDGTWRRARTMDAHNGKRGWTTDHHEGDRRSPVGVFTLSDAGGVLPDPGTRLPYTRSDAFTAPRHWAKSHWHDFDLVVAIDYNRVRGTSPLDPTRPLGQDKGGGIWLHLDHGSGTSGCVSLSKASMEYLLRTLDPEANPVVVMGDREHLGA
ncbi:L,D-transpeptidase family protein [Streptomyces thermolineatus]|uniref:L,D-transpeptidase family protein n=1 Tax=Streptomyces thermolineatus TaxID=44033 RepID=UPI00384B3D42